VVPLLKPIRYVFFRILTWKLKDYRESTPVLVASMATSVLLFFNVLLVAVLASVYQGRSIMPELHRTIGLYLEVGAFFLLISWLMSSAWVANGNLAKLQREFEAGGHASASIRNFMFWSYVVFSVAAPLIISIGWGLAHH
jgi:hypothetical protein